jgi:hypothetical protein
MSVAGAPRSNAGRDPGNKLSATEPNSQQLESALDG